MLETLPSGTALYSVYHYNIVTYVWLATQVRAGVLSLVKIDHILL